MEPTQAFADQLLIDKIRREHRPGVNKDLFDGIRLFQRVRGIIIQGIRDDFPNAEEAFVERERDRRLHNNLLVENLPWTK